MCVERVVELDWEIDKCTESKRWQLDFWELHPIGSGVVLGLCAETLLFTAYTCDLVSETGGPMVKGVDDTH